jgi:hypothetical protein
MSKKASVSEATNYMSIMCPSHPTKTCGELFPTAVECVHCDWNTNRPVKWSTLSSGWQICPKCQGQGKVWYPPNVPWNLTYTGNGKPFDCDVCKGKKIISIETGLPPD